MSPRAAGRLTRLGFGTVYDYTAGKADWLAAGLPTQGTRNGPPRALDELVRDVTTCLLGEQLGDVIDRTRRANRETCVVVDPAGIVHGRLRPAQFDGDPHATVETVMELGPTTVRANEPLDELRARMARRSVNQVLVTTPEGRLLGIVTPASSTRRP